ncbi:low molecular weight phosphatase family protein [soil metagenome]
MFEVLTVCTGNICRSPLAEQLLRLHLTPKNATVTSAGTRGLNSAPMTPEALALADQLGVPASDSTAHRSRFLTESMLVTPDLIITMTREHRRMVAELAPSRMRSTFTAREFARLAADVTDDQIRDAAAKAPVQTPGGRVRAAATLIASRRGMVLPPDKPEDDDVIDPFGRSWQTYELSAAQLTPALDEVVRVLTAATLP